MDYFEKNFQGQNSSKDQELPDGFSWEEMKEGVKEKMEQPKPTPNRTWWMLSLLLLIGGCSGYFGYQHFANTTDQTIDDVAGIELNDISQINNTDSFLDAKSERVVLEKNIISLQENQSKVIGNKTKEELNNENKVTTENHINFNPKNKFLFTNSIVDNKIENEFKNVESKTREVKFYLNEQKNEGHTKSFHKKNSTPIVNSNLNLSSNSIVNWSSIELLESVEIPLVGFQHREINFSPFLRDIKKAKKETVKKSFFSLALAGGFVTWKIRNESNVNYPYVKGFPGYSIQPSIAFNFNNRHGVKLAYQYNFLQEKFEYTGDYKSTKLLKDALVRQTVSSLTESVISSEFRDTVVGVTQSQEVLHYNQYKHQSIKLNYVYSIALGLKSSLDINLGGQYAFNINGNGKRLERVGGKVLPFDENDYAIVGSRVGLNIALDYSFSLSPKYAIKLGSELSTFFNSPDGNIDRMGPLLYGIQTGLIRKF